jgi:hypothetical protein
MREQVLDLPLIERSQGDAEILAQLRRDDAAGVESVRDLLPSADRLGRRPGSGRLLLCRQREVRPRKVLENPGIVVLDQGIEDADSVVSCQLCVKISAFQPRFPAIRFAIRKDHEGIDLIAMEIDDSPLFRHGFQRPSAHRMTGGTVA